MEGNKFTIKFTPKAYEDLDEIYGYIANNLSNEIAAISLMEKMEMSIMRLKDYPFSCSYVEDEILYNKSYRKLIVENYVVFPSCERRRKAGYHHASDVWQTKISGPYIVQSLLDSGAGACHRPKNLVSQNVPRKVV